MCQFINYIVLVFLLNSSVLFFNDIPGERFDNINAKWYANQSMDKHIFAPSMWCAVAGAFFTEVTGSSDLVSA